MHFRFLLVLYNIEGGGMTELEVGAVEDGVVILCIVVVNDWLLPKGRCFLFFIANG